MPNPNLSTLTDTFPGTSLNTTKWDAHSGTITVANSQVTFASSGNSYIFSTGPYNFDSIFAKASVSPAAAGEFRIIVTASDNSWNASLATDLNNLSINLNVGGSSTSFFYTASNQTWLRLRASSGAVVYESSVDGINWITQKTLGSGLTTTSVNVTLSAFVYGSTTPKIKGASVNTVPTTSSTSGGTTSSGSTDSTAGTGGGGGGGGGGTGSELLTSSLPIDFTKTYIYKVSKSDGTFIGVWKDVVSEPNWQQTINSAATTMTVQLARSGDSTTEQRDTLVTASGQTLVDQTGDPYVVKSKVNNTIGSGSDVDMNYFVDVYVVYGGFDYLVTLAGDQIVDQNGQPYVVSVGAPTGRRIFSGFILDYDFTWDNENGAGVEVTLASNGYELSQSVIKKVGTEQTTVDLTGTPTEAATVAGTTILATNPTPKMTSTSGSIPTTGVTIQPLFRLQTKQQGLQQVVDLLGANYWWYGNPADNLVYIKPVGVTANHTFVLGKHLNSLKMSRSMEQLANNGYFIGGNPGSGQIFKQYTSPDGSLTTWRRGLWMHTDEQYLSTTNTDAYAASMFAKFSQPIWTSTVEVSAATYDIETIHLGQMVQFRGSGNSVIDSVILQIVGETYSPYKKTLQLGQLLQSQSQIVTKIESQADITAQTGIPNTPS